MKLTKILTERISDIVYRALPVSTAIRNLENNAIKLTPSFRGMDYKFQKGKLFYLSLSRSKVTSFSKGKTEHNYVMYVLDGRKLSQNYKGVPIEYFVGTGFLTGPEERESEDRIISDKPVIPNASKYIKEIHVLIVDRTKVIETNKLDDLARALNIPIWYYDKEQNYITTNKSKAVPIENILRRNERDELYIKGFGYTVRHDDNSIKGSILYALINKYENPSYKIESPKIELLFKKYHQYKNSSDIVPFLKNMVADIEHEAKETKFRRSAQYTELLDKLSRYMRQSKSKNISQFIQFALDKK